MIRGRIFKSGLFENCLMAALDLARSVSGSLEAASVLSWNIIMRIFGAKLLFLR